jgi:hypothetical protein
VQVPLFFRAQVFLKVEPGGMMSSSGMVISPMKATLSQLGEPPLLVWAGWIAAGALVAWTGGVPEGARVTVG